jgi:hypothetical protein
LAGGVELVGGAKEEVGEVAVLGSAHGVGRRRAWRAQRPLEESEWRRQRSPSRLRARQRVWPGAILRERTAGSGDAGGVWVGSILGLQFRCGGYTTGHWEPPKLYRALLADISNVPTDEAHTAKAAIRAAIRMEIDGEPRIYSPLPLGGLKLPSSRDAFHGVIENGNDGESKWAVYATLRTGDVSVLPRVMRLLATGDRELPELAIAMQLQYVTDTGAVPDLIAILESAPSELTRTRVLIALGQTLKDPRAVPSLAAHLSDSDEEHHS